jgi:hypothetical protein
MNMLKKLIYLPMHLVEFIQNEACGKGISFSEMVRRMLDYYCEVHKK